MTLQEIGLKNQTDKASHHFYLPLYELLFRHLQFKAIKILEVGVQFGNSLRTWAEYFPFALIWGIDSVDNDVRFDPDLDIVLVFGDAYAPEMLERIGSKTFDLIIDDGSHEPLDQAWFVKHYAPLLSGIGVLIVEDVLTPETIPALIASMPEGFSYSAVEMPEGQSQVDSRLFLVWRRNVVNKS